MCYEKNFSSWPSFERNHIWIGDGTVQCASSSQKKSLSRKPDSGRWQRIRWNQQRFLSFYLQSVKSWFGDIIEINPGMEIATSIGWLIRRCRIPGMPNTIQCIKRWMPPISIATRFWPVTAHFLPSSSCFQLPLRKALLWYQSNPTDRMLPQHRLTSFSNCIDLETFQWKVQQ